MSCEAIEVHDEQQQLSQKPFQHSCQIGVDKLSSDVLPEPLPCSEWILGYDWKSFDIQIHHIAHSSGKTPYSASSEVSHIKK